jgi:hypothetical protein
VDAISIPGGCHVRSNARHHAGRHPGPRIDKKYEEVTRQLGVIRDEIAVRYMRGDGK